MIELILEKLAALFSNAIVKSSQNNKQKIQVKFPSGDVRDAVVAEPFGLAGDPTNNEEIFIACGDGDRGNALGLGYRNITNRPNLAKSDVALFAHNHKIHLTNSNIEILPIKDEVNNLTEQDFVLTGRSICPISGTPLIAKQSILKIKPNL